MKHASLLRWCRGAALIVPTLVLALFVFARLVDLETAPTFRLPIRGYDPVHLLHGHYVRFQFDQSGFLSQPESQRRGAFFNKIPMAYACLRRGKEGNPATVEFFENDQTVPQEPCDAKTKSVSYFTESNAYYIDESYAAPLSRLLNKASQIENAKQRISLFNAHKSGNIKPPDEATIKLSEETPPKTTVDLVVSRNGDLRLKMMNIEGKPWMQYLAETKDKD